MSLSIELQFAVVQVSLTLLCKQLTEEQRMGDDSAGRAPFSPASLKCFCTNREFPFHFLPSQVFLLCLKTCYV